MNLRSLGLTGYDIARKVGRSKSVVYKYLPRVKDKPRWTEEEMQVLVDGYAQGRPIEKIAEKVGRSPTAVRVKMCRHRKRVRNDPKKKEVLRLMTVATKAGLRPAQAISVIRRVGIYGRSTADVL